MERMRCTFITAVLLVTSVFTAQAAERHGRRPFDVELQMFEVAAPVTLPAVRLAELPTTLIDVPVHPRDPQIGIQPLDAFEPVKSYRLEDSRMFTAKLWLYETVAIGGGFDVGMSGVFDPNGDIIHYQEYNYAPLLGPNWGAAYTYAGMGVQAEYSSWRWLVEAQTPAVTLFPHGRHPVPIRLYGGYEPKVVRMGVVASDGWRRFHQTEVKDWYTFGVVTYDRWYLGLTSTFLMDVAGASCYAYQWRSQVDLTDDGRRYGLTSRNSPVGIGIDFRVQLGHLLTNALK